MERCWPVDCMVCPTGFSKNVDSSSNAKFKHNSVKWSSAEVQSGRLSPCFMSSGSQTGSHFSPCTTNSFSSSFFLPHSPLTCRILKVSSPCNYGRRAISDSGLQSEVLLLWSNQAPFCHCQRHRKCRGSRGSFLQTGTPNLQSASSDP